MRNIDGQSYYTVGEVAAAAGVSPQTIRVWERRSRARSRRTPGGHRLFDVDAMSEMVQRAAMQRRETAADQLTIPPGADITDEEVAATGARIRAARERANMTQRAVADHVGISRSLLSAIERGESGVSMTVFSRIADAVGIPMSELAPPTPPTQRLIRPDQRPRTVLGTGVTWEELATAGHLMAPAIMYADPGATSGGGILAAGETFLMILEGRFSVRLVDSDEYLELDCGDAVVLARGETFSWTNPGTNVARTLWVEQLRG
jgi:transcriptional regulator with XRE-family HTH domain